MTRKMSLFLLLRYTLLLPLGGQAFVIPTGTTPHLPTGTTLAATSDSTKRVVVVGNGMVGQRFMENLRKMDANVQIATFCEEPRAAYNRVQLTKVCVIVRW